MKKSPRSLSVVLPFYNEKKNIPLLLQQYKPFIKKFDFELLCVNNGSTDGSEKVFQTFAKKKSYGFIKVITVKKNIGYGHGIMSGVKKAKGDVVAWSHADMQTQPKDIFTAYKLYQKTPNKKTLIKGRRTGRHPLDTFVSFSMGIVSSLILRMPLYEVNAQPKLFPKGFIKYLSHPPHDFLLDLYCLFIAKKQGYQTKSFTVQFLKRRHGKSKWAHSWRSRLWMIKRTISYTQDLAHVR